MALYHLILTITAILFLADLSHASCLGSPKGLRKSKSKKALKASNIKNQVRAEDMEASSSVAHEEHKNTSTTEDVVVNRAPDYFGLRVTYQNNDQ
jgi:hypothetical protein